ncbi:putative monovalent cation/H+ antiporter subunit F [Clostridium liquoris]|uniref:Putative monovalent cation/H+ antiporter subunit F n=1 Tax=Clostridium liquoris TaxID=1289519 RepID=A0A2T0B4L5_9CLOT|nr:monovalent cation/H+ antiporter complex subunit F [Clostridium liquoris]PRR78727.1 putative monovalent cation/H+ antiporter subunit F [Clostridium liquoris]
MIDMSFEFIFISILIVLLSFLLLYRVFKGPNIIDRVVAADSIDVMIGLVMVLFGCYEGRSLYIDLGLIITLLGFIGTVLISRYLEGKI